MKNRKVVYKMKVSIDGREGEYSGQVDESGEMPIGRGVIFWQDGGLFEGHWSNRGLRAHGRELGPDG